MNRIVVILPRGEAIRNFIYSGALLELSASNDVTLLTIKSNEIIFNRLLSEYSNVLLLNKYDEKLIVRYTREILDTAHGQWLNSHASRSRKLLREQEIVTTTKAIKQFGRKMLSYPFASSLGLMLLDKFELLAGNLFRSTEDYIELYKELKPNLLFNGSQVHNKLSLPAIHAAKTLGIPTSTFVFSWDNLTSQGRIYPQYDYYLVWNEYLKKELLRIYPKVHAEQIFITGSPQFDFHFKEEFYWTRDRYCEEINADPDRAIILYTTGMANHVIGEPAIIEVIADIIREYSGSSPPQLVVRIYPKGPQDIFNDLKQRRKDILFPKVKWEQNYLTPCIEDLYSYTNALLHGDICINIASTVSLEMCMFDKPVINICFLPPHFNTSKDFDYRKYYKFEHYQNIVNSGAIDIAYSRDELKRMILNALKYPDEKSAQRKALIKSFFGDTLDGRSATRVAEVLNQLSGLR